MPQLPVAALGGLLLLACEHSVPFTQSAPDALGPVSEALPRQLTFNPGDDESPAGAGALVYYARRNPARQLPGNCLAVLPAAGGTLQAEYCPPGPSPADTFEITWREPAVSADGARLAFLWQRGARTSFAAWSHHVVLAPVAAPRDTMLGLLLSGALPDGRRFNTMLKPIWTADGRVRFLAAFDSVVRLVGGGIGDTIVVPRGLMELDPATRALTVVPGGEAATAYTMLADGTIWLVHPDDPALVRRIAPGTDSAVAVHRLVAAAADLTWVAGKVVAALDLPGGIEWFDPADGGRGSIPTAGRVRRVAGVDSSRVVGELTSGAGGPSDLWLFDVP